MTAFALEGCNRLQIFGTRLPSIEAGLQFGDLGLELGGVRLGEIELVLESALLVFQFGFVMGGDFAKILLKGVFKLIALLLEFLELFREL